MQKYFNQPNQHKTEENVLYFLLNSLQCPLKFSNELIQKKKARIYNHEQIYCRMEQQTSTYGCIYILSKCARTRHVLTYAVLWPKIFITLTKKCRDGPPLLKQLVDIWKFSDKKILRFVRDALATSFYKMFKISLLLYDHLKKHIKAIPIKV